MMTFQLTLILITKILALIFASFVFWRRLKEDYRNEEIFSLTLAMVLVGLLAGIFFSSTGVFLGSIMTLVLLARWNKWNGWFLADAAVDPFLIVIFVSNLSELIFQLSYLKILLPLLVAIVFLLDKKMGKRYRSLSWYKSGKIGFVACFSIIAFFGLFLLLEIFTGKTLYWQMFIHLGIFLGAVAFLYTRSERNLKEDWQELLKKLHKYGQNKISR